ncbi:TPA: hypothetical protein DCW38_04745 [candidate division WOR-3 bacterium]|jgi:Na+-driven multidrug efflux pump|uniref:Uncharacterized protein n=1 Tax=candidate division WOR-3 bacterium TaxID=2052148 RepID=A0A350HAA5_UNCW3|nr:hypothetical protein [candidate division WOR-3 bacterium]
MPILLSNVLQNLYTITDSFIKFFVIFTLTFFYGNLVTKFFINDAKVIKIGESFFKIISYSMLLVTMMKYFSLLFKVRETQ